MSIGRDQWTYSLRGKGLYHHLQSEKLSDSSSTSLWDQEDNQIISLMLNNIEPHIGSSCIYLPIAKDIWDHLRHMVLGISLGFMRCVNNILGFNMVLKLWTSTTIRLWQSVRRGTSISRSPLTRRLF
jgi:hypothetical protein